MIMKQSSGSSNGVITFRKVVLSSNSSSSSGSAGAVNGTLCYAGNTITPQVMNNGVLIPTVAGVATNGSLFHSINGSSGVPCSATPNVVSVGTMLASNNNTSSSSSNGLATSVSGTTIATINANGVLQSNLANGNATIRTQNGKIISAGNVVSAAPTSTGGKLCLTQQQLQKLLEQQLQQQPQQGSQPQIIRLQNPQQQLIRLQQQPQQVMRLQQPAHAQIIRIAPNKLQQGHQLPDGRIIFPQPIQITPQQLQQLQQRQHTPIALQPLQFQSQQQQVVLPGVQLVSVANAHALLEKQQQSVSLTNQVVATTSQHIAPSQQQLQLQAIQSQSDVNSISQSQQLLNLATNQDASASLVQNNLVSVNGLPTSTPVSVPTGISQSNSKESQPLPSPLGEVELNVLSSNQEQECEGAKASQLINGEEAQENTQPCAPPPQQDNDDDDIQEVGQVINTISNGMPADALKSEELHKKEGVEAEGAAEEEEEGGGEADPGVIDIVINNVVCSYSVGCHINLRDIATHGSNVEYRREHGMVTMKLRRPPTTASIWSSGKITCTGSTSEVQARTAARRVARSLQKLGCKTRFKNFRVVNVLGTCTMPFAIKITPFSRAHRGNASYEPELHPGVTYRIAHPKATLKIFSTGSITVTAPSIANVQAAIEHVYPLVKDFSKERTAEEEARRNASSSLNRDLRHPSGAFFAAQLEEEEEEEEEAGVGPPPFVDDEFLDSPPSFTKRKRRDSPFGPSKKLAKLAPIDLVSDDSDDSSDDMEDVDDGFS